MLTSLLRTIVPYVWGLVVTWLITLLPVLAPLKDQLLGLATIALPILAAVLSAAWYAFWRWLEPRLPDWLTRAVLGSAKTPVYLGKHAAETPVNAGPFPNSVTLKNYITDEPGNITVTNAGTTIVGDSTP